MDFTRFGLVTRQLAVLVHGFHGIPTKWSIGLVLLANLHWKPRFLPSNIVFSGWKRSFKPIQWIKIKNINQVFFLLLTWGIKTTNVRMYMCMCMYIYIYYDISLHTNCTWLHPFIYYIYIYILEVVHLSLICQWINNVPVNCWRTTENKITIFGYLMIQSNMTIT